MTETEDDEIKQEPTKEFNIEEPNQVVRISEDIVKRFQEEFKDIRRVTATLTEELTAKTDSEIQLLTEKEDLETEVEELKRERDEEADNAT